MKLALIALILSLVINNIMAGDCSAGYTQMSVTRILDELRPDQAWQYILVPYVFPVCTANNIVLENVSAHSVCNSSVQQYKSYGFYFEFGFTLQAAETIDFRFGIDFGLGGLVIIDGVVVKFTFLDQWWNHNWMNASNLLLNTGPMAFGAGCHVIQILGKEACCDGDQTIQMNPNSQGWVSVSPAALGALNDQIIQASPPCFGEDFWVSNFAGISKHWCYCNCWIPGAAFDQTKVPPYNINQLSQSCVLDPTQAQPYTVCSWNCPVDSISDSYGVIPLSVWQTDCQ